MKESSFKKKVLEKLKGLPRTFPMTINQVSISGTPDLIVCVNGRFVAWELKKDLKSKPTKLQEYTLQKIRDAGGWGIVVRPENLEEEFERLKLMIEGKL